MSPHKSFLAILMALFFIALPLSCSAEYGTSPAPDARDASVLLDQQSAQFFRKTYEDMYQKTWSALQKGYFFRHNMGNWFEWQHKFDGKLTSLAETETAIRQMIKSLHDPYTFYLDDKDTSDKKIESAKTGIVTSEMLEGKIGYIKVSTFNSKNTAKEVGSAVQKLKNAKALIIDLQENFGGYIDEAIHATALFLQEGVFITIDSRDAPTACSTMVMQITKDRYTGIDSGDLSEKHQPAIDKNIPIVILVNEDTASASEMFAGCLQEHKRAKLVGQITLGKGVCQELETLPYSTSLRYTYAQWNLPVSGKCVHKKGLIPDIILPANENAKQAAIELLRSKHVIK